MGSPARNSHRAFAGTEMLGRRERSTPAWRSPVPGKDQVTATPRANTMASPAKMTAAGSVVSSSAAPVTSPPRARPASGAALAMTGPSRRRCAGADSATAAVREPLAAPVAPPWIMRTMTSILMLAAVRNSTLARTSRRIATTMTGLRPM
jgi:hypothetical protein